MTSRSPSAQEGRHQRNVKLEPGDVIIIPESMF
jgi:hypothetical protein